MMQILSEIIGDSEGDDFEDEEEEEIVDDVQEESKNDVFNGDLVKLFSEEVTSQHLLRICQRAQPIPQFLGFTQEIEELLDDLQESSLALIL